MNTAAKVRQDKESHPEKYCRVPRCLWRTGGAYGTPCRNHPVSGAHSPRCAWACSTCDAQAEEYRELCEHCGRPIANAEDGEMRFDDPRVALFCWSNENNGTFCDKDPKRPGAPHPRDCTCSDCYVDEDRE